jgi:hypothetical protein
MDGWRREGADEWGGRVARRKALKLDSPALTIRTEPPSVWSLSSSSTSTTIAHPGSLDSPLVAGCQAADGGAVRRIAFDLFYLLLFSSASYLRCVLSAFSCGLEL